MDRRKIVLLDAAGRVVAEMDVSHIDHADYRAPMLAEVRTRCDLGDWHAGQSVELYPWGNRVGGPPRAGRQSESVASLSS